MSTYEVLCDHDSPNYEYRPLEPGQIRVLDLLSRPGEELRCRLRHISITCSAPAQHAALSYVWGDASKPFWIPVISEEDDRVVGRIPLTVSLHNALQDLRDCEHFEHPKTFWIDQLCINQTDDAEKSDQVAQMMRIYETARETATYLGPREPGDEEALLLLHNIYCFYKAKSQEDILDSDAQHVCPAALLRAILADPIVTVRRFVDNNMPVELDFEANVSKINPDTYTHLIDKVILSSSWHERVWLVQENAANRHAGFLRGPAWVTWDSIGILCALTVADVLPWLGNTHEVAVLHELRWTGFKNGSNHNTSVHPLSDILCSLSIDRKCADVRDKIYAIMGLASDAKELGLQPDYQKCPAQVYTDLALIYLQQHRSNNGHEFELLDWVGRDASPDPMFPSWVPSYASHSRLEPAESSAAALVSRRPTGISPVGASIYFESTEAIENAILVTTGIRLGRLGEKVGTFSYDIWHTLIKDDVSSAIATIENARARLGDSDNTCVLLCHTLIMNSSWPGDSNSRIASAAEAFRGLETALQLAAQGVYVEERGFNSLFYLPTSTPEVPQEVAYVIQNSRTRGRALWLMENGGTALVPDTVRVDDVPVVLLGAKFIYFLRPCGNNFKYMGSGYVHGLMSGEVFSEPGWEGRIETLKIE